MEQQQGVQEEEQQQLVGADEEEQQRDGVEQQQHGVDPIYAELEPRAPLPLAPVRRPRSRGWSVRPPSCPPALLAASVVLGTSRWLLFRTPAVPSRLVLK